MIRDWSGEYFMQCSFFSVSHSLVFLFKTPTFNPCFDSNNNIRKRQICKWHSFFLWESVADWRIYCRILYLEVLEILFYIRSDIFWLSVKTLIWTEGTQSKNPKLSSAPVMLNLSYKSARVNHFLHPYRCPGQWLSFWVFFYFIFLAEFCPVLNPHRKHPDL